MWQICGHIPQTLMILPDITSIAAQLSVSFLDLASLAVLSIVAFKVKLDSVSEFVGLLLSLTVSVLLTIVSTVSTVGGIDSSRTSLEQLGIFVGSGNVLISGDDDCEQSVDEQGDLEN